MLPTVDPIIRTVYNMMASRGGDTTVIVTTGETTYDPATSLPINVTMSYAARAIVFDYLQKSDGFSTGAGLIQQGDRQMFLKPSAILPRLLPKTTSVMWGGRKYSVVTIKEVNPSGNNIILYELFIRE